MLTVAIRLSRLSLQATLTSMLPSLPSQTNWHAPDSAMSCQVLVWLPLSKPAAPSTGHSYVARCRRTLVRFTCPSEVLIITQSPLSCVELFRVCEVGQKNE